MADETEAAPEQETTRKKAAAPRKRAPSGSAKKRASSSSGTRTRKTSGARPNAVKIARAAREQLSELLGRQGESVIGVQRTDDGWEADIEVVETARIPDTTDVLAIYRVQLDGSGDVEGYQRIERYIRGKAEGGVVGG